MQAKVEADVGSCQEGAHWTPCLDAIPGRHAWMHACARAWTRAARPGRMPCRTPPHMPCRMPSRSPGRTPGCSPGRTSSRKPGHMPCCTPSRMLAARLPARLAAYFDGHVWGAHFDGYAWTCYWTRALGTCASANALRAKRLCFVGVPAMLRRRRPSAAASLYTIGYLGAIYVDCALSALFICGGYGVALL